MKRNEKLKIFFRLLAMVLVMAAYPAANMLIDPFGVFGDRLLHWTSYSETNNPRAAKLAWLEDHHQDFDSYIIGSSCAASLNPLELNGYLDARFYNLFVYGSDARDYRDHAAYVLSHYEVKNLLLNLNYTEAITYDTGQDDLHYRMHPLATGENPLPFYLQYAFCAPEFALDKLKAFFQDTELPQSFDVFDAATGCYDKRLRDIERVGDPEVYEAAHGADFRFSYPGAEEMPCLDQAMEAVRDIRDLCDEKGVRLIVVLSPAYAGQLAVYSQEAIDRYRAALAEITDFWDFSQTSLSYDSRYFYDASHFRNAVGTMVLAEIFGNGDVWRPQGFGTYVTAENCAAYLSRPAPEPMDPADYTREVPLLMYHAFGEGAVTAEEFANQLDALEEAGYTTVSIQDMIDYVYHGAELPEKPVCITMDDGYLSNYDVAFPLLRERGMTAAVFAIGVSVGHRAFYKDTDFPLTPHFGWEEAREMAGVIDLQSHTWDLHQWAPFETGDAVRTSALPLEGESEEDYAEVLAADLDRYEEERIRELGSGFSALAYPGGFYSDLTEVLIHQAGIPVTATIRTDSKNVLVRGLPQSLCALCRFNVTAGMGGEKVVEMLEGT